ncbi:MAG TPA: hydantoinase B/oxoprolinase family protein [Chloroflexota bacterium]|nr:hydantoinase B/oxoprolinase family protein [Chloroflexota bacterium]
MKPIDAVTAEIIRNALVAITDEMKTNLMRTAYTPIIYEALDYTVGLFDAEGETVSIGLGLPMFIGGLSDAIKGKIGHYAARREALEPGDIILTNDSYLMGSHLNHMIFSVPIFWEGQVVAWSSSMAHWQDVGGVLGGATRDIYSEGLQLPIVKIFKRGIQDNELTEVIRANVRFPDVAMGDFRAQIAAIRTGERRFIQLLTRYGPQAVLGSIRSIFETSERLARAAVATLPDGTYNAESFMDDDGVNIGTPIPIRVQVRIAGDQMTVDLSDVSRQVPGYYNSGATAGRSAAQLAFKALTTPLLLPINVGSFRPLQVVLPPGRVVSATRPGAMRMWMTIPMTVVDTIFRALAPAMPEHVIAGHHADLCVSATNGIDRRTGRFFIGTGLPPGGGFGAKYNSDGMSATVCINDGDTHNSPTEAQEAKAPVVVEEYALRPDSGGAGQFRGGLGVRRAVRMLTPAVFNIQMERTKCAPWGLNGGKGGLANRITIRRADGSVVEPPNGKLVSFPLQEGDVYIVESGGGGGFGDPKLRDPERVRGDVRAGYVTPEAAERVYGVVFAPDAEPDG